MNEELRVILVVPPGPLSKFSWSDTYHYPLGLLYLASYLEKHGVEVKVLDCIAEKMDFNDYAKAIRDFDVVGVTAVTSTYNQADNCLKTAKALGKITVLGGIHVTALPNESIVKPFIDYAVLGEGEITSLELMRYLNGEKISREKIKGICFKNRDGLFFSERRPLIKDLDLLPYPALEKIDFPNPRKYRVASLFAKRSPVGNVITSRGCPFNCLYCGSRGFWGANVRFRSIENIIGELGILIERYGVKEIKFWDDTFTLRKERVIELCKGIIEEGFDLTWSVLTRVDCLEKEMLKWMKRAGCWEVDFGIDSGNQKMLNNLNKQATLHDAVLGVKLVKDAGIEAKGNLIFGIPGETPEMIRESIEFVKKLDLDYLNCCIMCPIPNSNMFEMAKENGWIFDWNWDHYTAKTSVMDIGSVSPEYLVKIQRQALKEFYIRPHFIFKRLRRLRSWDEFQRGFGHAIKVWRGLD